jgi:hypothetical protein
MKPHPSGRLALTIAAALVTALAACADPVPEATPPSADAPAIAPSTVESKADDTRPEPPLLPPPFSTLKPAGHLPDGLPLWVSNNPEHVFSSGLLLDCGPAEVTSAPSRGPGAPAPSWQGDDATIAAAQGCSPGGLRTFSVYLAHILAAEIPAPRRLVVALVQTDADDPAVPVTAVVRGAVDTSGWSRGGAPATRRTDWLGAALARQYFFGDTPTRAVTLGKAAPAVAFEVPAAANALVEGRFDVTVEGGCAFPRIGVLGGPERTLAAPGTWARGDVKWPGWFEGKGYGRAAGLYAADAVSGEDTVVLAGPGDVQGRSLLTAPQSVRALARPADSAEVLFGNYGVLHHQRFRVSNPTQACLAVDVALAAYTDRGAGHTASGHPVERAPTYSYLVATQSAPRPTMVWNGPFAATVGASPRALFHPVFWPEATPTDRANPRAAMQRLHQRLGRLRLEAGAADVVELDLPVPGYITAPLGVLFSPGACNGAG